MFLSRGRFVLQLKLFGTPSVEASGQPVPGRAVQGPRLALLAALALTRGRPLTRDKLIALLWPESPTDRARHQLSDTLYLVRGALGEDVIRSTGDELMLNPAAITSDVESFQRLLDEGQLGQAVELIDRPLLDGFHLAGAAEFEQWLDVERARLGQRYATSLESLAEASEARGDFGAAAAWWRKLATHDAYSGRIALRLMRALEAAGDRAGALRHARVHAALLQEEFEAKPDPEVMSFAERLRVEPPARVGPEPANLGAAPSAPPAAATTTVNAPPLPRVKRSAVGYAVAGAFLLILTVLGVYGRPYVRSSAPAAVRTLAVMPFVNMSADPENTYFSDGLSEQIITVLSRIDRLRVVARTSSFALRDRKLDVRTIGDTLDVGAVLEGSVRKDGNRLKVTAQLIDAETGYHMWSEEYDRELRDIFAMQEEIAQAIADALELRLPRRVATRARHTPSLEAYDLYLRGLFLRGNLSVDALQQATELFNRTIELEPDFALAYAAKATVIAPRIYFRHVPLEQGVRDMRDAVARALALDAELGEAQAALGVLKLFFDWDWTGAEKALRRAITLNSSDPHAYHMLANYLRAMNRVPEAIEARLRSVQLDPLNARTAIILGNDYAAADRFDLAITEYQRAIRLDPSSALALGRGPALPAGPAVGYLKQGRYEVAVDE
ncbi:MAG: BTAD domain-containing putative transcriptional regulator, partial [Gemmatimonadota bacterium]